MAPSAGNCVRANRDWLFGYTSDWLRKQYSGRYSQSKGKQLTKANANRFAFGFISHCLVKKRKEKKETEKKKEREKTAQDIFYEASLFSWKKKWETFLAYRKQC